MWYSIIKSRNLSFAQIKDGVFVIYNRIRDLREDHDLKQKDVADYLFCAQQTYSNYELGQRDIPTAVLIKLSELYRVSVDYILGITNNPKQNR